MVCSGSLQLSSYQPLISEGVVDTSNEKPKGPQILKAELEHKVSQQDQHPHYQELQVQERAVEKRQRKTQGEKEGEWTDEKRR